MEYFAANFKGNPIDIHLDSIVRAKLEKFWVNNKIDIKEMDEFAKKLKQKEKDDNEVKPT